MRDEFSDELDGDDNDNAGNHGHSRDTRNADTGNPGDEFWRDISGNSSRSRSRIEVNESRIEATESGSGRSGRKRKSGSGNAGIGSAATGNGPTTDGSSGSNEPANGTGSPANGDGDGRRSDDSGSGSAEETVPPRINSFRINPPKGIEYDDLGKSREKKKPANAERFDLEILKLGVEFAFTAPTLLLPRGTADHWPLDDSESTELAKRLQQLLSTLPTKRKTRLMKLMEQHGPWIMFAVSASLITYPKIQETRRLLAQQRANNAQSPSQTSDPNAGSGFQRYPNFGTSQARNTPPSGSTGSESRANGNRGSGFFTFDAGAQDY